MSHSEQINELAIALAAAQGMMKPAKYNRQNPHFKNKYADLAAVWDAIRDALAKNGLSVAQTEEYRYDSANPDGGEHAWLETTLFHKSGQWLKSHRPLPVNAKPQEYGSALTYARRYSLSAIVGIASDEDDDATEAQKTEIKQNITTLNTPPPGPVVKLTDAQIEQIRLYTAELNTDQVQKMLTWLNVKSIADIGQHQYDRAIGRLAKTVGRTLGGEPAAGVPPGNAGAEGAGDKAGV